MPINQAEVTERVLLELCKEFIRHPYLCYTEHGLHALLFNRLYAAFESEENRYATFNSHRVCLIQKEYPTHHHLGRSRRQHWDISVIKAPIADPGCKPAYDHFRLAAVVEFGMNCGAGHLVDDIERLTHPEANLDQGFLVHLDRFSDGPLHVSDRDWNARYTSRLKMETVAAMLAGHPDLYVLYGIVDQNDASTKGLWKITSSGPVRVEWRLPSDGEGTVRPS